MGWFSDDSLDELTGDAKNYAILKKNGHLPWHIFNFGDYLAWKAKQSQVPRDPLDDLSGEAKNFALLKKLGYLPNHIDTYGDYLAWKKRRSDGEPEPGEGSTGTEVYPPWAHIAMPIVVPLILILCVFFLYRTTFYPHEFPWPFTPTFYRLLVLVVAPFAIVAALSFYNLGPFRPTYYKLHVKATHLVETHPLPTASDFYVQLFKPYLEQRLREINRPLILEDTIMEMVVSIYHTNIYTIYNLPDRIPANLQAINLHHWWLSHPNETLDCVKETLGAVVLTYLRGIPNWAFKDTGTLLGEVNVATVLNTRKLIGVWVGHFFTQHVSDMRLFNALRHQLNLNRLAHSSDQLGKAAEGEHGKRINAEDFVGSVEELIAAYLPQTFLAPLLDATIPYRISQTSRFEHVHVVAPSGHGKTHGVMEKMIVEDLKQQFGLIVISPNDELLEQIARAAPLHDLPNNAHSVTFIDPADGPALGIFDVHLDDDELAVTHVVNEIAYFCQTLLAAELTTPMAALIAPLAQLMCTIPGSNLTTFIQAIDNLSQFADHIDHLPNRLRDYLRAEIKNPSITPPTRAAIKARLNGLLFKSPSFDRMFNATVNRVDIKPHIDGGGVLLVNCNDSYGQEQARLLGKYFISRTLQALLQRQPNVSPPAFLYIDEAWMFLDNTVSNLLRQARKYNVGLVVAEPDLVHADPGVHRVLENVAVMLAAGYSASKMPMEKPNPDLVTSMRTAPGKYSDFVLYDRHRVMRPTKVRVPMLELTRIPSLTRGQYQDYRRVNASRLVAPAAWSAPPPPDEGEY